ncbi:MAG: bifunctional proline dehydrogenase/L-glutamate gamma-semialdehyde dehydrogenase PutA, partial [Gammaproteobacteria bacterium]|nr:bifunctional proline dehydrogenase/L-glutamate gamma-semialdehyde dehydrogenase PutA [Gammaproteobacteria bacterium]
MDDHIQHVNINENYLRDEASILTRLLSLAEPDASTSQQVHDLATRLVQSVRTHPDRRSPLDRFLSEYDLASEEGVLLMCLAESLLRVPDPETADELIADKIKAADWEHHIGNDDLMVNASTWCLMLTGRLLPELEQDTTTVSKLWREIFGRLGEPVIRRAINLAMRIISEQFVMGTSIEQAIDRSNEDRRDYECFSFDMLGEAALTAEEARNYLAAYEQAITTVAAHNTGSQFNSVSVKLSALSPRFEAAQWDRALNEISERLGSLAIHARQLRVPLTVDAEESDRLEMTLAIFEQVFSLTELKDWNGFGIAVQAYQKRALDVIDWLAQRAQSKDKSIPVRLVKGAYWDNEIKQAQLRGLADYPVFTLKRNTDVSYLAGVQALNKYREHLHPQFATHNARTVAYITHFFKPGECEFQRLHGMGEGLYEALNESVQDAWTCRVYAPVGSYETLLPYLVRRLLENGANTSFVHRIADPSVPLEEIVADPVQLVKQSSKQRHSRIPLPADLYGITRRNSSGINFGDRTCVQEILAGLQECANREYLAGPVINGDQCDQGEPHEVRNPARPDHRVGTVKYSDTEMVNTALNSAAAAWQRWNNTPAGKRAEILEHAAELVEARRIQLMNLCIVEAGKTIVDAHNEIRETVDFLRYYAAECRRLFGGERALPGPVGESNRLRLGARGVFFCVSPWNFPMAIYTGQVSAALAAGNAVLAKPAEQSSLCAWAITELLYEAGIPKDILHFLPGDGESIAREVLANECLAGVAFTGSVEVAKDIEKRLARKPGAIATLIAETGGINAMLVDSSALPEQVVQDVITSAFNSAGQRCSALR